MDSKFNITLKACYIGYITQAIIANLAPLLFIIFQTKYNISFEMLGSLILVNFTTQLIVDIIAIKLVIKTGYRPLIVGAHILSCIGLICLGTLPNIVSIPYIGLVISVIIYAIGGGLIEVLISPIAEGTQSSNKSSAMSLLHSCYCLGQIIVVILTTILLAIFGHHIWPLLSIMWAIIPFANIFIFLKAPLPSPTHEDKQITIKSLLINPNFILFMIIMICSGASELTMSQWSSLFAEQGLGVSKVMGDLLGPCLFAILMGLGRVLHGIWGSKLNLDKLLLYSTFLCMGCYLLTVFAPSPIVSLISCGITGLSVSLMWPGTLSLASSKFPFGGAVMFGILAVCGDIGCAIGPFITGIASNRFDILTNWGITGEQAALKNGILIGVLFPLILCISLVMFKLRKNEKTLHI